MKLKADAIKNPDGTLNRIEISWRDAEFYNPGPGLDQIFEKLSMLGVLVLVASFFYYAFAHKPDGLWWGGGIVGFALAVKLLEWWQKRQKHVKRELVIHGDGRIQAKRRLPDLKPRHIKKHKLNVMDFDGFEYQPTNQWVTLPSKYNTNVAGGWYDVYGTREGGRRIVFARNCWNRDTNHHLALTLGEIFRDVQQTIKSSASAVPDHQVGPVTVTRGKRVID